jgi:hypothetical protein
VYICGWKGLCTGRSGRTADGVLSDQSRVARILVFRDDQFAEREGRYLGVNHR